MTELIVKYKVTDASITELREQYSIIPRIETNAELKSLKKDITVIRTLRTSVETTRKELKKDALEYGRRVDTEANRIKAELLSIEKPMKDEQLRYEAKAKAEREEKARIERERVLKIHEQLSKYDGLIISCATHSSAQIERVLHSLNEPDDFDYQEFAEQHTAVLAATMEKLGELLGASREREQKEAEAAERERLETLAAIERERLAAIEREALAEERRKLAEEKKKAREELDRIEVEHKAGRERLAAVEREKREKEAEEREAQLAEQEAAQRATAERERLESVAAIKAVAEQRREGEKREQEGLARIEAERKQVARDREIVAEEQRKLDQAIEEACKKSEEAEAEKDNSIKNGDIVPPIGQVVLCPGCGLKFEVF